MSEGRASVNIIGNAVAAIVMAKLEGELDVDRMQEVLSGRLVEDYTVGGDGSVPAGPPWRHLPPLRSAPGQSPRRGAYATSLSFE